MKKTLQFQKCFFVTNFFCKRVFNKYLIIYNRQLNVNRNIAQRYCIFVYIMLYYRKNRLKKAYLYNNNRISFKSIKYQKKFTGLSNL